ncbi:MAG TPA: hypothetical protein VD866_18620, partial [Urbifossiella sp.]|nr:hypothetical protein [Urbifossiella sp.]
METLEDRLAPATFTWDGGGANDLWSTPANWQNDAGPAQLTYRAPTALVVNTTVPGQPGQNEVQTFLVPGEDGTFTLATNVTGTINGVPIAPNVGNRIPSNVDLTTLQTLFNTAYGNGNTILSVVTQPGPSGDRLFTVQFRGTLANTDIPQLSGVYTPT